MNKDPYGHQKLIGQQFGNLKVTGVGETNKNRKKLMKVICLKHPNVEEFKVVKQSLIFGRTTGCSQCWLERHTKHGYSGTHTYACFMSMINRTTNPEHKSYNHYKNIDIDSRYTISIEEGIQNFIDDNGIVPDDKQIDRIDNSKGYYKENIRYVTVQEQQQNKSNNVITPDSVKKLKDEINNNHGASLDKKRLMKKYNISRQTIEHIIHGTRWNNIN